MDKGRFQSTKVIDGFSTCFRQWRAFHSHCSTLHGYALSFKITFEGELDEKSWIVDHGDHKRNGVKDSLSYWFDHTTVISSDDPHLKLFKNLHKDQIAQIRILDAVGTERFAELAFAIVDFAVRKSTNDRCNVLSVECFEHSKNSSICLSADLEVKQCKQCGIIKTKDNHSFQVKRGKVHGKCKDCLKEQYRNSPSEKYKALRRAKKRYIEKGPEVRKRSSKWYIENRARANQLQKKSRKARYHSSEVEKLKHNIRSIIHSTLKKQNGLRYGRTKELLSCSFEELKLHLEMQFKEGMTWDNYGEWHVDHIKPCAAFNLKISEEQHRCFHFTNLQPLWSKDNIKKGSTYKNKKHFHKN